MNKLLFIGLFVVGYLLLVAPPAFAATFSFKGSASEAGLGDAVEVRLVIDAAGQEINALEGEINLGSTLKVLDIREGDSIVSFWVEAPSEKAGRVRFSGIVPGGYGGREGLVLSLIVKPLRTGSATVSAEQLVALLNDGVGTRAAVSMVPHRLLVKGEGKGSGEVPAFADLEIPESFQPLVAASPNLLDGRHFIVFSAKDKISGIDHYEVAEKKWFRSFSYEGLPWATATSPHLLSDQTLVSNIYVKAVDREGNVRVVFISPTYPPLIYNYGFIFAILLVTAALFFFLLRRVRARHATSLDQA